MSKSSFPTLLESKATILGNFTRVDLVVLGSCYLALSWMKVSGILSLAINVLVYLILKYAERNLPKGFIQGLRGKRLQNWGHKIGRLYE